MTEDEYTRFNPDGTQEEMIPEIEEPPLVWKILGTFLLLPFVGMMILLIIFLWKWCWELAFG